jgi:hypothetical protein
MLDVNPTPSSYMTFQLNFLIYEENLFYFFISVSMIRKRRFYVIQNMYLVFLEVESIQYLHALTNEESFLFFYKLAKLIMIPRTCIHDKNIYSKSRKKTTI